MNHTILFLLNTLTTFLWEIWQRGSLKPKPSSFVEYSDKIFKKRKLRVSFFYFSDVTKSWKKLLPGLFHKFSKTISHIIDISGFSMDVVMAVLIKHYYTETKPKIGGGAPCEFNWDSRRTCCWEVALCVVPPLHRPY